jgi:hypothetical protein
MKLSKFFIIASVALCISSTFLSGQSQDTCKTLIKPFGFGLHIEQFKLNDITDLNDAPANKLIFTYSPNCHFRIEPELGFRFNNDKTSNTKTNGVFYSLGIFGMVQHNKLNLYSGLRLEYDNIQSKSNNDIINGVALNNTTNRFMIGPVLGGEYFLGNNFTLGAEVAIKYVTLKKTYSVPNQDENDNSNYFMTDSGLFLRFYF